MDETPTMQFLDKVYGDGISDYWIDVQLTEIFIFTGLRDKVSDMQRKILVSQLRSLAVGYCVTISEMMVFFMHFEYGRYGEFKGYERPNMQVITKAFEKYLYDLREARYEVAEQMRIQKNNEDRKKWAKDAVPMPDYVKKHLDEYGKKMKEVFVKAKKPKKDETMWIVRCEGKDSLPMPVREVNQYIKDNNLKNYEVRKQRT